MAKRSRLGIHISTKLSGMANVVVNLRFVKHFHKTRANFVRQIRRDNKKIEFCEMNDIKLIEIYPDDELSEDFFANLLG